MLPLSGVCTKVYSSLIHAWRASLQLDPLGQVSIIVKAFCMPLEWEPLCSRHWLLYSRLVLVLSVSVSVSVKACLIIIFAQRVTHGFLRFARFLRDLSRTLSKFPRELEASSLWSNLFILSVFSSGSHVSLKLNRPNLGNTCTPSIWVRPRSSVCSLYSKRGVSGNLSCAAWGADNKPSHAQRTKSAEISKQSIRKWNRQSLMMPFIRVIFQAFTAVYKFPFIPKRSSALIGTF